MAQIGVMTTEFEGPDLEVVAEQIAAHQITAVQLQLGSVLSDVSRSDALLLGLDTFGDRLNEELATSSRHVLAAHGITIAAVDGTYNMIHPDVRRRERNRERLITLIELAPAFGTDVVAVCTGSRADVMWQPSAANQSEDAWRDLVEQLRIAARVAERVGVRIAFEPEYNNVVDSAQRARRLIDELASPAVQVVMDMANLFHHGDLARMDDHVSEVFEVLGADIVLAHAKDLDHDGDAGGRAAGEGMLDYPRYLSELQNSGFDGTVVLHQLNELAPDRLGRAFRHVRESAPVGYLDAVPTPPGAHSSMS